MPPSGTNSQAEAHPSSLPLFRAEALAAQERLHGEVLLIRPFSLAFFARLAIAIAAVVLGFLLAGHYTEKARVTGFLWTAPQGESASALSASRASASAASASTPSSASTPERLLAVFDVPAQLVRFVQPGETVSLRCPGCPDPWHRMTGTVMQISGEALAAESTLRVTIALPSHISQLHPKTDSAQSAIKLEAEIPLGRRPLIHWLFERSEPSSSKPSSSEP